MVGVFVDRGHVRGGDCSRLRVMLGFTRSYEVDGLYCTV